MTRGRGRGGPMRGARGNVRGRGSIGRGFNSRGSSRGGRGTFRGRGAPRGTGSWGS
jgi:hypothetical protein